MKGHAAARGAIRDGLHRTAVGLGIGNDGMDGGYWRGEQRGKKMDASAFLKPLPSYTPRRQQRMQFAFLLDGGGHVPDHRQLVRGARLQADKAALRLGAVPDLVEPRIAADEIDKATHDATASAGPKMSGRSS